jgi:dTDP-glucose 4,6-dehydratase
MGKIVLVTGGAGFIGSNFVRYLLENDFEFANIIVMDSLTYAGHFDTMKDFINDIIFFEGDIRNREDCYKIMRNVDVVVNFAAESHVDNSIKNSSIFVETNVVGVQNLLQLSNEFGIERFVQISTDETYGSIPKNSFREDDRLKPASPYSSTKASADLIALSYHKTFGLDVVVTRSANNFGPYQLPEKVIPLFITNLIEDKKVPVYGEGANIRDWIYVADNCGGIVTALKDGSAGEIYNIGCGQEMTNLELTNKILNYMGKDEDNIDYVEDRVGHDFRYSINTDKIRKLGWRPIKQFDYDLLHTVEWYKDNENWWKNKK